MLPLPLQDEDAKRVLFLNGNNVSQVTKDVIADLHKLRAVSSHCPHMHG